MRINTILVAFFVLLCSACTRYRDGTVVYHRLGQTHHRAADGTVTWTDGNQKARDKSIEILDEVDGSAEQRRQQGTTR